MGVPRAARYDIRNDNTSKPNTAEEEGRAKTTRQMSPSLKTPGAARGFHMPHALATQQWEKQKPSPAKF